MASPEETGRDARGSLVVVGTGIRAHEQATPEAVAAIAHADKVFYGLSQDTPAKVDWLTSLNADATSLMKLHLEGRNKSINYNLMVDAMMDEIRSGKRVCAVFFGHPGIFCMPAHRAIKQARAEGFDATMLPGISAEDCLLADLGIDPGDHALHSETAETFLLYRKDFDTSVALVLWQVAMVGRAASHLPSTEGFRLLTQRLGALYGAEHEVTLYEANEDLTYEPIITTSKIAELASVPLSPLTTMFVPPGRRPSVDTEVAEILNFRVKAAGA